MPSSHAASQEELKAAKVPLGWRDQCSAYVLSLLLLSKKSTTESTLVRDQTSNTSEYLPKDKLLSTVDLRE